MGRARADRAYRAGDQIHVAVTAEFAPVATEFFHFCRRNHFNPSEVIRGAIAQWLQKQKEMDRLYRQAVASRGVDREEIVRRLMRSYEESVLFEEGD